jgi:glutathione S-transferase
MTPSQNQPLIRLHSIFPYDRSGKARWLLTEMGVAFEDRWLDREKEEYNSLQYLRLNPMGRVPTMEIGDQSLFESGAICAVLADRFIEKGMAPALASPERTKYQQWMYFAASTVDTFQTRIMIIEDIPAGEIHSTKESALLTELGDALNTLDQTLAKDAYLVGSKFSAADICVSYHLYWCKLWPEMEVVMKKFPRVLSYLDRLEKMPSAVKSKIFSYEA